MTRIEMPMFRSTFKLSRPQLTHLTWLADSGQQPIPMRTARTLAKKGLVTLLSTSGSSTRAIITEKGRKTVAAMRAL